MKTTEALNFVLAVLPGDVKRSINMLPENIRSGVREILLRTGKPVILTCPSGLYFLGNYGRAGLIESPDSIKMSAEMMQKTFMSMCDDSVYSYMDNINSGFITLAGGSRVGVCGRFVNTTGGHRSVRNITSLSIRISGEHRGITDPLIKIYNERGLGTTLIAGPPCSGKTTFLRDLCRNLSGGQLKNNCKVSLIDERCEISGADKNDSVFNVGVNTDIYLNYEKSEAIIMSIRTMSPDVIVFDEIGGKKEVLSIREGMNSGVDFVFSIHADGYEELKRKEQYKLLLENTDIKYIVFLEKENPGTVKEVWIRNENNSFDNCFGNIAVHGDIGKKQGIPSAFRRLGNEEIASGF